MNFWQFWQLIENDDWMPDDDPEWSGDYNPSYDDDDVGFTGDDEGLTNRGFWGNAGAGVLAIAADTGKILVQLRSGSVEEPYTYGVVGGAVKASDVSGFERAASEEFEEETGARLQKLIPAFRFQSGHFVYQNFIGIVPSEFQPRMNWEADGYEWVTWEELLRLHPKHFGLEALIKNSADLIKRYARGKREN